MNIRVETEVKIEIKQYKNELNDGTNSMCQAIKMCPIIDESQIGCKMCIILFNTGKSYNKENYNKLMKKLKDGEFKDENN